MAKSNGICAAKLSCVLFLLGLCILTLPSQNVIENPGKPQSRNAGRTIKLKELLRIRDGQGDFYFKQPSDLKASREGLIFYADLDEMLYKFEAGGNFVKNLLRKGEGPGEIRELDQFVLGSGELFIFDGIGNKIIRKDFDGNLTSELKFEERRFSKILTFHKDNYYVLDSKWTSFERKSGIKDLDHNLYIVNQKGESLQTPFNFPDKMSMKYRDRSFSMSNVNRIQFILDDSQYLYINHTTDYLVKMLDLEKREMVRSFKREYDRVKFIAPKEEKRKYPEYFKNLPEFHNDIQKLLIYKNRLWVLTSTIDEQKGILTDVFDHDGHCVDSFYLPLFRWERRWEGYPPATIIGNNLYTVEWEEDGKIFIVKYEIIDENQILETNS